MRAITICQPYAHLIVHGGQWRNPMTGVLRTTLKRVENRTWWTNYRGPMLVHAGKSTAWIASYDPLPAGMQFGAIIGRVDLVGAAWIRSAEERQRACQQWPWLLEHEHTDGPCCLILERPVPCDPFPYRGGLGIFDVPGELVDRLQFGQVEAVR